MHVTDWFTTILHAARLGEPTDRVIDGVNQLDWLTGGTDTSRRDGYIYWMGPEIYGVKWRNFKLVLVAEKYMQDPAAKLPTPRLINLATDPQSVNRSACRISTAGSRPTSTGSSANSKPACVTNR